MDFEVLGFEVLGLGRTLLDFAGAFVRGAVLREGVVVLREGVVVLREGVVVLREGVGVLPVLLRVGEDVREGLFVVGGACRLGS